LGLFSLDKRRLQGNVIAGFQYLKGAYRKHRDNLFRKTCFDTTRCNGFKLRECTLRLDIRKIFFYHEGGETLEQVAHRGSGGSVPRNIQGQVGRSSEQPDLTEDVPGHCGGGGGVG